MFSWFKSSRRATSVKVVPRIKHENFLHEARQQLATLGMSEGRVMEEGVPIHEPLAGDLILTYAIDFGPGFMFLDEGKIKEHSLDRKTLRSTALATIAPVLIEQLSIHALDGIKVLQAPENLAACSILFPRLWENIGRTLGQPVVAGFMHRDHVLFVDGSDATQLEALHRELATAPLEDDNHNLSRLPFRFVDGQWRADGH